MARQHFLTHSLVCCLLLIGSTNIANAQRRHKAITTKQKQPLFLKSDTLPIVGSMAKIGKKQMNKGLVNSAINALSGQAVGVNVVTNGQDRMAMLTSVRVRGTTSLTGGNDPLVLIDGVSSDLSTLSTIYPADIESFTILKNASETSKYGSRGASGVIEVKTKRGNGSKFQIYYDGTAGFDVVYKRLRMLNATEYVSAAKALGLDYVDKGYDTNFQKEIVRTGFVNSHHVAFSGGSEKSNYRASLGYVRGQTVIKSKDYNNFVAKLDISQLAFDERLKIDFGAFGSSQQDEKIFDIQALSYSIAAMNPTLPFHKTGNGWQRNGNASQIGPTEPLLFERLGAASDRPYGGTGSSYADPSLTSFMGTLTYTLLDRYTLNLTTRADGSSMVGKDHTWGIFPSISATWDMKKESFLRNNKSISLLNLRTGYGRSGNLGGISSYLTLRQYIPVGLISYNGTPTVTMGTLRNSNPDLRWETRSTFNIGTDLGLFNNRLLLTAEYYYSKTTDMLYEYDVPVPTFAFDKLLANIGSMSNSGFELGIGVVPISKKDMELNVNVNMAWQKNKLLSLNGKHNGRQMTASEITPIGGMNGAGFHGGYNDIIYQIVGQPLGVFYLPHCKGIVDNGHGHNKYDIADLNNDNVIDLSDHGDRYIAGQATPKMTLGSNISFRYKAFDISLQMNGAFGHKIFNGTTLSFLNMSNFPDYNVLAEAPARNIVDQNVTDYWLEKGDYLNFDYLTIGWNTPVKNKYISSLRVSFSINNLATITSYSGLTPIINSYVVDNTLGIDDKRTYPPYRTYSIGVSIKF